MADTSTSTAALNEAEEELREEFEEIVGEELIMALVNELADLGHEWAPTIRHSKYTE